MECSRAPGVLVCPCLEIFMALATLGAANPDLRKTGPG
jgi:hypothetical protein